MTKPRLHWFKCFPTDFTMNPEFLAMSCLARGAYWVMLMYCWAAINEGGGISSKPAFLQHITKLTPLEWDSVKTEVLPEFQLRDEKLHSGWLDIQMEEALDKYHKLQNAGYAKAEKEKSAKTKEIDESDEIRLDKIRLECTSNAPANAEAPPNGQPSPPTPSSLDNSGGIAPPPHSPTSGHLAAPTSGVPLPVASKSKAPQEKQGNPDVQVIQEHSHELGWKLPKASHVQALLDTGASVPEICEAMDDYAGNLNVESNDSAYAEYDFFAGHGGLAVIHVQRKHAAEAAESQVQFKAQQEAFAQARETAERHKKESQQVIRCNVNDSRDFHFASYFLDGAEKEVFFCACEQHIAKRNAGNTALYKEHVARGAANTDCLLCQRLFAPTATVETQALVGAANADKRNAS